MHDDDMNDDDLFGALRDGLSKLQVPDAPPLENIVARGRTRRRRSGLAGVGLAAVGLAIALPVIVTSVNRGGVPVATHPRLGSGPVHVNLAAYSVDSNPNGTVTVALATKRNFDPAGLRQALAQAGVAAVVNFGVFCQTAVQPTGFTQVVYRSASAGAAHSHASSAGNQTEMTAMVIKPSAMPRRAELSIGYFPNHVAMTLVKVGGPLSCFSMDPPGCDIPVAGQARVAPPISAGATTTLPSASATTTSPPVTTTSPPATATSPPATATGATATGATGATTSLANSTATSLPPGAQKTGPPLILRCRAAGPGTAQVTAPGTTDVTGVTGTATTAVPSSASTTVVTAPAGVSR
jgi:hypothetical protein